MPSVRKDRHCGRYDVYAIARRDQRISEATMSELLRFYDQAEPDPAPSASASPFKPTIKYLDQSPLDASRHVIKAPHKRIAWLMSAIALILAATAATVVAATYADLPVPQSTDSTPRDSTRQFSQTEYLTEKARAWNAYRKDKARCDALPSAGKEGCVDQARRERRHRIADARTRGSPAPSYSLHASATRQ